MGRILQKDTRRPRKKSTPGLKARMDSGRHQRRSRRTDRDPDLRPVATFRSLRTGGHLGESGALLVSPIRSNNFTSLYSCRRQAKGCES